jgi:hypothetical protein
MNAHSSTIARRLGRSLRAPRPCRQLHLAPPFLLDDYIPRYQTLSSRDAARKRSAAYAHLRNCNLCPRLCGVNRYETTGMCLIGDKAKVNVIAPHFGEGLSALLSALASRLLNRLFVPPRTLYSRPQWQWRRLHERMQSPLRLLPEL